MSMLKDLYFLNIVLFSVSLCILSFPDVIKEVIDQQSTVYDNVTIVANFFKYEQVSVTFHFLFIHNLWLNEQQFHFFQNARA